MKNWANGDIQLLTLIELINFLNENILKKPDLDKFYDVAEFFSICVEKCKYRQLMRSLNLKTALNVNLNLII